METYDAIKVADAVLFAVEQAAERGDRCAVVILPTAPALQGDVIDPVRVMQGTNDPARITDMRRACEVLVDQYDAIRRRPAV